eukprot:6271893-Amphidinium_carterae.1
MHYSAISWGNLFDNASTPMKILVKSTRASGAQFTAMLDSSLELERLAVTYNDFQTQNTTQLDQPIKQSNSNPRRWFPARPT